MGAENFAVDQCVTKSKTSHMESAKNRFNGQQGTKLVVHQVKLKNKKKRKPIKVRVWCRHFTAIH